MGGFQVADHDSVFRFTKFKMADPINQINLVNDKKKSMQIIIVKKMTTKIKIFLNEKTKKIVAGYFIDVN